MTSPRLGTDPRNGLAYPYGDPLPSAHLNYYTAHLRALDLANETQMVMNWVTAEAVTYYGDACVCWYPAYQTWVLGCQNGAIPDAMKGPQPDYIGAAGTPGAGDGLTVKDICGWGNYCVMCGTPGSSSNKKYRYTVDGCNTWGIGTSGLTSTSAVNSICHHYTTGGGTSLFVAGGSSGEVETSPTGLTWTQRTAANANTIKKLRSNGTIVVGVTSANSNKCVTSANGTAWSERTMATTATWVDVCYAANQGYWVALGVSGGNIVLNKSADGITWQAVTVLGGVSLTYTPYALVSSGNALILLTITDLWVSFDLGANWRSAQHLTATVTAAAIGVAMNPSSIPCQLFCVGADSGDIHTEYYASMIAC